METKVEKSCHNCGNYEALIPGEKSECFKNKLYIKCTPSTNKHWIPIKSFRQFIKDQ